MPAEGDVLAIFEALDRADTDEAPAPGDGSSDEHIGDGTSDDADMRR